MVGRGVWGWGRCRLSDDGTLLASIPAAARLTRGAVETEVSTFGTPLSNLGQRSPSRHSARGPAMFARRRFNTLAASSTRSGSRRSLPCPGCDRPIRFGDLDEQRAAVRPAIYVAVRLGSHAVLTRAVDREFAQSPTAEPHSPTDNARTAAPNGGATTPPRVTVKAPSLRRFAHRVEGDAREMILRLLRSARPSTAAVVVRW